jgi:peptidoglycan/LPS O-acetylase OafA/YrhL
MRGVVVVIGMLFHANAPLFKSGFFFVDVFGVLSGYLITRMLLGEYLLTGRIGFKNFYLNRARRLLPALFLVLVVVTLYARAFEPQVLWDLRIQILAALGYFYNWYAIFAGGEYFSSYDIIPIQHLWSLSLEEQFYMIWPVALIGMLFVGTKLPALRKFIPHLLLVGAAASAVAAWMIFHGGDTTGTTDMVRAPLTVFGIEGDRLLMTYMSTITRAGGFLVGCAMAFWWQPDLQGTRSKRFDRVLDVSGLLALAAVFVLTNLQWFTENVHEAIVNGGAVMVWGLCAVLIMAFTKPESRWLHATITRKPMIRLGVVSYALYLYHWPVMQFVRKYPFKSIPLWALALVLPILWVIAELSQKYFERPVRRNGLVNSVRTLQPPARRAVVAGSAILTLAAVAALITAPRSENLLEAAMKDPTTQTGGLQPGQTAPTVVIGDSITHLLYTSYQRAGIVVDAAPARTFVEGSAIARYLVEQGQVTDSIVMHLGTNENLTKDGLRAYLDSVRDLRRVVLVTLWREDWAPLEANNANLRSMVDEYENLVVIDWNRVVAANPDYILGDGIHISRGVGADAYLRLVEAALAAPSGGIIDEVPADQ